MPLPNPGSSWPPETHKKIFEQFEIWDAWLAGDRDALAKVYGGQDGPDTGPVTRFVHKGGVAGALRRFWWGEPPTAGQRSPKLHVPAAADIASTSANLLFAEPPSVTLPSLGVDEFDDPIPHPSQSRVDALFDDDTWARLHYAAELCAGLGGVYLRVGWDRDVADRPLVSVIGPDAALPTFRWGRLREVTFCWQVARDDDVVWRHLEHHEVEPATDEAPARGVVRHALMEGDADNLGRLVPLTESHVTAPFAELVDETGAIATGLDRLTVVYVPNRRSHSWRNDPISAEYGRPDIAGVEPLLDALDEAWSSWQREIRLGKARAVVDQTALESHGPGKGATFDADREIFVGLNHPPNSGAKPVELIQPEIRHAEHAATCTALYERCVSGAGWSPQTFGLTAEVAMTATESHVLERKSHYTRGGKIREWDQGTTDLAEIMLAVDTVVFEHPEVDVTPQVEFPSVMRDNPLSMAQTLQALDAADAASTPTKVRMAHPDWSTREINAEVALIEGERPKMPDPDTGWTHAARDDEDESGDEDEESV